MEDLLKNTTTLDKKAYKDLFMFNLRFLKGKRIWFYVLPLCIAVFYNQKELGSSFFITIIPVLISVVICAFLLPRLFFKWSFNRIARTDKRMRTTMSAHYTFRENGVECSMEGNSGFVTYGSLHKVYESDICFYLFMNAQSAYIVSKSGFTSDAARQFRTLM